MKVYPRLAQRELKALIGRYESVARNKAAPAAVEAVAEFVDCSALAPTRISHPPVGTRLVDAEELDLLRIGLREVARRHGYPTAPPSTSWSDYDRETAAYLHAQAEIVPCDAGSRDMWAHFSGWLGADLVLWRWGTEEKLPAEERWGLGTRAANRNQFSRLWWRAELLGDHYLDGKMGEDQVVALLERPSIGFNPPLSRAVAAEYLARRADLRAQGMATEKVMREAMKRLRRALPARSLYSVQEEELRSTVSGIFDRTIRALDEG